MVASPFSVLNRYLLRECAVFFGLTLFAFTAVLLTLRMLRFANLIVAKGVEISQIIQVFLAIIPTFLEIAIPLATLLGVMLAFSRLSGDSEIIVLRASGISIYGLIKPVLIFGVVIALAALYVSQELRPWGYKKLAQSLFEIARSKSTSGLEQGVFNKLGVLTIYAERIDPFSGNLVNVMIDDRRSKELRKVVFAHSGVILSDSEQRRIVLKLRDGQIHEILEGKYTLTNFVNNSLLLNPDELFQEGSKHGPDQNELEYSQLREKIDYYTELEHLNKEKEYIDAFDYIYPLPKQVTPETVKTAELRRRIIKLQVEFGLRFALPFASLALAILGMALGIQPARTQRSWGAGISAVLGLSVFVLYYGMFSISLVLAQSGTLHPYLALWAPNLAILALACFLITRIASERWHSVAQALQNPLQKISGSFPRPKLASGT